MNVGVPNVHVKVYNMLIPHNNPNDLTDGCYLLREGDPRRLSAYHRATLRVPAEKATVSGVGEGDQPLEI